MAVGTDKGRAGTAEVLEMQLVTDAVAGGGEDDAVPGRHCAQKAMVVRIAEAHLQGVVIDVAHRKVGAHPVHPHGLELKVRHGPRGVLREGLVDAQGNGGTGCHVAVHEMGLDDLLGLVQGHVVFP